MAKAKLLKIWETALLVSLCISLCAGAWAQKRQSSIASSLVRLHVLAHSDDEAEQALKLRVRDAVLEYISPRLLGAENVMQARKVLEREMEGIARAAAAASEGRAVSVSLGEESYPTKAYEGFKLPAGDYESLRVTLGEGEGQNWWCIVFPPVCLSAVQSAEVQAAMNKEDYALVADEAGWELRFKTVELWGELKALLENQK